MTCEKHYQDMRPLIYAEKSTRIAGPEANGWHRFEGPCPDCHASHLVTNGKGDYLCNRCGHTHHVDGDEKYKALGQHFPVRRRYQRGINNAHLWGTEG